MIDTKLTCSATGNRVTNDAGRAIFDCPKCGEEQIVRSSKARALAIRYKCSKCGFTGPN